MRQNSSGDDKSREFKLETESHKKTMMWCDVKSREVSGSSDCIFWQCVGKEKRKVKQLIGTLVNMSGHRDIQAYHHFLLQCWNDQTSSHTLTSTTWISLMFPIHEFLPQVILSHLYISCNIMPLIFFFNWLYILKNVHTLISKGNFI